MRRDVTRRRRSVQKVDRRLKMIGGIAQHLLPAQALVFSHGAPRSSSWSLNPVNC
jgi:hypothetical protein